jgi:hypothetical protein
LLTASCIRPRLRSTGECKERGRSTRKFHGLRAPGRHRFSPPAFPAFLFMLGAPSATT